MWCHREVSEVSRSDTKKDEVDFQIKSDSEKVAVKRWAPWCSPPSSLCARWADYQQALSAPPVLWKVVPSGSSLLIWKLHREVMNESESFSPSKEKLGSVVFPLNFPRPEPLRCCRDYSWLFVQMDGTERFLVTSLRLRVSVSPCPLVFDFFCCRSRRSCPVWRREKKRDLRGLPLPR